MAITRDDFPLPDVTDPLTAEFFAGAARGELVIPRCDACGRWVWYPEASCPGCGGALTWTATSGRGRLFSWAVVRRAFLPAFAEMVPFVTALVALEEDEAERRRERARSADAGATIEHVRLVTYVVDVDPAALADDLPLAVTFRPLSFPTVPGREVVVPMFTTRT